MGGNDDRRSRLVPILTLCVSIVAVLLGPVATQLFPEQKDAIVTLVVAVVVLGLFVLAFWYGSRGPVGQYVWTRIRNRWRGPDMRRRTWPGRVAAIVVGGAFRFTIRRVITRHVFIAVVTAIVVGVWTYRVREAHSQPESGIGALEYAKYFAFRFLAVLALLTLSSAFLTRLRSLRPEHRVRAEVNRVLSDYAPASHEAAELWSQIVEHAQSELMVASINAIDLLERKYGRDPDLCLLDAALTRCPGLQVQLLIADPLSRAIRVRNWLLNGRFSEYYGRNFVRMMLWWQRQVERADTASVIELRTYERHPTYRMVISEHRLVVQRYALIRHGREDDPLLLYRVVRSEDLSPAAGGAAEEEPVQDPEASLYQHFRGAFMGSWNGGTTPRYIRDWPADRLKRLARMCKVRRRHLNPLGNNTVKICEMLYTHLGLTEEGKPPGAE